LLSCKCRATAGPAGIAEPAQTLPPHEQAAQVCVGRARLATENADRIASLPLATENADRIASLPWNRAPPAR